MKEKSGIRTAHTHTHTRTLSILLTMGLQTVYVKNTKQRRERLRNIPKEMKRFRSVAIITITPGKKLTEKKRMPDRFYFILFIFIVPDALTGLLTCCHCCCYGYFINENIHFVFHGIVLDAGSDSEQTSRQQQSIQTLISIRPTISYLFYYCSLREVDSIHMHGDSRHTNARKTL